MFNIFGFGGKKAKWIDLAIEKLGQEGSYMGTAFKEISYSDMLNYIKSRNCKITVNGTDYKPYWIEFIAEVGGKNYEVTLSKTNDGYGSVITSRKI